LLRGVLFVIIFIMTENFKSELVRRSLGAGGPKDVFLQIGSVLGLYISVLALGALIFQLVNIYFPDVLAHEYGGYSREGLRWPLAILVVAWPLCLWLNYYIQRELISNAFKRELKTRKWLLYFTLFVAAIVIAGDLVTLIFRFLSGELTVRFVLKVFAVLAIAGGTFAYYGWNIKKEIPALAHPRMKIVVWGALGLVFAAMAFGFYSAGSPQAERLRRLDERRVSDLQQIQWQIINYWQAKEKLPGALGDLRDSISGFVPPADPETGESYEYRATGDLDFELCAVFKTSNKTDGSRESKSAPVPAAIDYYADAGAWSHGAGRVCFERKIDPELYPPLNKPSKR